MWTMPPRSVLEEVHDPYCKVCGCTLPCPVNHSAAPFPTEDDVPLPLRQELMRASRVSGISYYWLCAIYRQGLLDARKAATP